MTHVKQKRHFTGTVNFTEKRCIVLLRGLCLHNVSGVCVRVCVCVCVVCVRVVCVSRHYYVGVVIAISLLVA